MFAAPIGIQAVSERDVWAVVVSEYRARAVDKKLGGYLPVLEHLFVQGLEMQSLVSVRRIEAGPPALGLGSHAGNDSSLGTHKTGIARRLRLMRELAREAI
jgi:hypothetical protein